MMRVLSAALALALISGAASAQPTQQQSNSYGTTRVVVVQKPKPVRVVAVREYRHPRGQTMREWNSGDRIPSGYRTRTYYVTDYKRYDLRKPPRGHSWVRVGNDVVLVRSNNGKIADVVRARFN
jgi:Ni/Co efflux regulator RcnB